MAGATRVDAIDIEPFAIVACRLNGEANGIADTVLHAIEADPIDTDDGWDVVLVGDLWYEPELAGRMEPWLRRAGPAWRPRTDRRPRAGAPAGGRPRDAGALRGPDDDGPRGHALEDGPRAPRGRRLAARLAPPWSASERFGRKIVVASHDACDERGVAEGAVSRRGLHPVTPAVNDGPHQSPRSSQAPPGARGGRPACPAVGLARSGPTDDRTRPGPASSVGPVVGRNVRRSERAGASL